MALTSWERQRNCSKQSACTLTSRSGSTWTSASCTASLRRGRCFMPIRHCSPCGCALLVALQRGSVLRAPTPVARLTATETCAQGLRTPTQARQLCVQRKPHNMVNCPLSVVPGGMCLLMSHATAAHNRPPWGTACMNSQGSISLCN